MRTATRIDEAPVLPDLKWEDVGELVDEALAQWVASSRRAASTESAVRLWDRLESGLEGGKRVRPQLVFHAYRAFGGTDAVACATLGAAVELLHGALVVHDDVIDRDFVRRGRPNVAGLYRDDAAGLGLPPEEASHRGASVAVIGGDLLLAGAFRLCDRSTRDAGVRERLSEVLHTAVEEAAAGELDDVLMAHDPKRSIDDVLAMERLKTATYSFAAPLRLGAILAGAPDPRAADVARVGLLVGTAYQVIDDVLGTFGDEQQTGKPVTSDLREGKLTVLTAYASRHPEVARHLAEGAAEASAGVDRVREILREVGADAHALTLAHSLATEALDEARRCDLPPALRSELTRICNHVLHREH
ncbi:geranylgeranyl pyrophosphate synthase [Sinomonas cellulolyticus]|uniref:Polyprenyl synthetase family protein n=1 Tax=Sinomonas cellulolyticus TaxID=2801916 RepID=A0ABS1K696_9MICC|nr:MULTISPECIES: polyprenyl synthetase family protein [Sinomonas]MBL0707034.1 polyprenyl synthetase family protein [Sinomonas cellulolyticus]GHG54302.1 geranylgeranyl pyrophosphate synthase [Sinomonas sp. KCTC 49339]